MCDSAGSICDRRCTADCAGAECNVSSDAACHNDGATKLVGRTGFVAGSQSDSADRRGSGFNTGAHSWRASRLPDSARHVGGRTKASNRPRRFIRNVARHNASRQRRPGSGLYTSGLSEFDLGCCAGCDRSDLVQRIGVF